MNFPTVSKFKPRKMAALDNTRLDTAMSTDSESEDNLPLNIVRNTAILRDLFNSSSDESDFEGFDNESENGSEDDDETSEDVRHDEAMDTTDTGNANRWEDVNNDETAPDVQIPAFTVRNPCPRDPPARNSSPMAYFSLFFTVEILTALVRETKRYARQVLTRMTDRLRTHRHSRFHR